MVVKEAPTFPVEEAAARHRFEQSYLDDVPSPFCELLELTRIERDCPGCGGLEEGWFERARLLHGGNAGTVTNGVWWDGCPCGRGGEASCNGPAPLIVRLPPGG